MTVLVDTLRYARVGRLLWRDTGRHVLVLLANADGQVLSIGGGAAAVWRLLDRPRSLAELQHCLAASAQAPPDLASLALCLRGLRDHGVLRVDGDAP